MVDFNNETTATIPPQRLMVILILQRRADVIDSFQAYDIAQANLDVMLERVKSRLRSLFWEIYGSLKRNGFNCEDWLKKVNSTDDIRDLHDRYYEMDVFLDKKGLKFDNRSIIRTLDAEVQNVFDLNNKRIIDRSAINLEEDGI